MNSRLTRIKSRLWPSPYKSRFVRELADHAEDAGPEAIGDPVRVAEFFNRATGARRTLLGIISFFLFLYWCSAWMIWFLRFDETPMEAQLHEYWFTPIYGPFALVGFAFFLPYAALMSVTVSPLADHSRAGFHLYQFVVDHHPLCVSAFYATLYALAAYRPWRFISFPRRPRATR